MIEEIGREVCDLLEQQMKAIAGRGFRDLTPEELANYEQRRIQIANLRSQLAGFVLRS